MRSGHSLRILLVGDYQDDPRFGSAKVSHKLREEFVALGHHCDLLFGDAIGIRPRERQLRQLISPWLAARAIHRARTKTPYDVVDVSSAEGLWFGIQKRAGRFPRTAYICRSHGLEHLNYRRMLEDARAGLTQKPWTRRLWYPASRLSQVKAAAKLSDRLVVLNRVDRDFASENRWLPADRIDVVPHGVSERFLAHAATEPPVAGHERALFCGAWDHVKGVHYLVDAWTRLHDQGNRIPLTVLGPGFPSAVVLGAFPPQVRPLVTVIDRVPETRVLDEYRRHAVLVFPSTYEGFGLVVLEALSQGLPVIGTDVGCAAELVTEGATGARIPVRDGASLAVAVARVMGDAPLRRRMRLNAANAVRGMTWRATAEKTLAVYHRALVRS
jgi:glycosyltransferase involved in cell wall biosynthesis